MASGRALLGALAIDRALDLAQGIDPPDCLNGRGRPLLLEQNDEWAVQRGRHMTLEMIAPMSDDPIVNPPAVATASDVAPLN